MEGDIMASKTKKRKVHRSAVTGRFVTKKNADRNPNTTVTETIPITPRKRKPKKKGKK